MILGLYQFVPPAFSIIMCVAVRPSTCRRPVEVGDRVLGLYQIPVISHLSLASFTCPYIFHFSISLQSSPRLSSRDDSPSDFEMLFPIKR